MNTRSDTREPPLVWRFLRSVRLTITLLIILAVVSVLGTVIPQGEGPAGFANRFGPGLAAFLSSLQLFDMYHSFWFRILIGLLSLNLVICSLDRFPAALKRFQATPRPDRSKVFENLPPGRHVTVDGDIETAAGPVAGLLRAHYKRVEEKDTPEGRFLYGERGRYSNFGVYLVHLSVLLILVGGIIGSIFGFEAYVAIPEGETVDRVTIRKTGATKMLPFLIACEKFAVDFYDSGAPREFRSDLRFFKDGNPVLEGRLLVNHPITFKGITFYQSNYGTIPGDKVHLKVSRTGGAAEDFTYEVEKGRPMPLPGKEGKFQVVDIHGNLRGMMGPAALVSVQPDEGKEHRFWIFQNLEMVKRSVPAAMLQSPRLNPAAFKPYTFFLENVESRYYTGLQVNRDPGVPLVWAGFFMIVIGLFTTFFVSHRRVWIRLSRDGEKTRVSVACRADKNPVGAERETELLVKKIRNRVQGSLPS
jgi:cytochrome c biogenesis protein